VENNIVVQGSQDAGQWQEFLAFLATGKNTMYYQQLIHEFMKITTKNPLSCSYDDIVAWWDNQVNETREINGVIKKLEFTTANMKLAKLSAFYEIAMERGLINFNPVKNLIKHKIIRRITGFKEIQIRVTEPMVRQIIHSQSNIPGFIRVAMLLFLNTAVRISELLSVKYTDIAMLMDKAGNPYYQINIIGKGNKYASKIITVAAYNEIMALIKIHYPENAQKSAFIVPRLDGKQMTRQNFDIALRSAWEVEFGNRNISAHSFRHLAITLLYQKTGDILKAMKLANHASVTTTQRYSHITYSADDVEFVSDDMTDEALEDLFK
jgi:integrase/recombinase XerC